MPQNAGGGAQYYAAKRPNQTMNMADTTLDRADLCILYLRQIHGRLSNQELAQRVS